MVFIWLAVFLVLCLVEAFTTALVCIWFIIGAVAAFISAFFTTSFLIQFIVFVVASGIALVCTKSILKDKLRPARTPTNADRVLGHIGEVTTPITADIPGRVLVENASWAAKCSVPLTTGTHCKVVAIEGVTLVVEPV